MMLKISQLYDAWIIFGVMCTAPVFCASHNDDNTKLLCYICEDCSDVSSTSNTPIMECNADYFNNNNHVNNDDNNEIMATVITVPQSKAINNFNNEATITTIATTLKETPNIAQSFNLTIYNNRSRLADDDTVDGFVTTTIETDVTSAEETNATTIVTIAPETTLPEEKHKRTFKNLTDILSESIDDITEKIQDIRKTTTEIPTITTKLKPILPINPELVIHPSTEDIESEYIKNYNNTSTITTTPTQEAESPGAKLLTNSKNYKPSNDFRIRSTRHTLPNISYHCFKLQTYVNGSTIIKRGCAMATTNNIAQSVCEQWQHMHPHLEINHCEACTQTQCNGCLMLHLPLSVLFFTLTAALFQPNSIYWF